MFKHVPLKSVIFMKIHHFRFSFGSARVVNHLNSSHSKLIMYSTQFDSRFRDVCSNSAYTLEQLNGQRIYKSKYETPKPTRGCEIFVGKLPKDMYEDTLVPMFLQFGPIYKFRLMLDFNGKSKGYCFVTYYSPKVADNAVATMNDFPVKPGHKIGVYKSIDNCRLFMGGVPPTVNQMEVYMKLRVLVEGITQVIMYPSYEDKTLNRGFAFLEFEDHRAAAIARRKLAPGSLVLWGSNILVDWADPLPEPDPVIMANVSKLYLRNLPVDMTHQELWNELQLLIPIIHVSKIHKCRDYAFIHMVSRKAAEEAMELLKEKSIRGHVIEVDWARPKIYSKEYRLNNPPTNFCLSLPPKMRRMVLARQGNKPKRCHSALKSLTPPKEGSNHFISMETQASDAKRMMYDEGLLNSLNNIFTN